MTKRPSLFAAVAPQRSEPAAVAELPKPVATSQPTGRRYPVAKTREGKRVATVYLEAEALKRLQMLTIEEDTTIQDLLVEGINAVFEKRGLGRLA
jgi:hypothetical protein